MSILTNELKNVFKQLNTDPKPMHYCYHMAVVTHGKDYSSEAVLWRRAGEIQEILERARNVNANHDSGPTQGQDF